jgi:hypothetical protein
VYVDGVKVEALPAASPRGDVAAAYPTAGAAHGFEWRHEPAEAGPHQVCVYALNVGFGTTNPTLGCRTVTTVAPPQANPVGSFDTLTGTPGGLSVRGWLFDPDSPTEPAVVHLYMDGAFGASVTADGLRPDVGAYYAGVGDRHGWSWNAAVTPGPHRVCAFGINTGPGTTNPVLGCKDVVVLGDPTRNPVGHLDTAGVAGGRLTVTGWAFDPDTTPAPAVVHLYVDGAYAGQAPADVSRPDVPKAYPVAGPATGFQLSVPVTPGAHQVCVYAINSGAGTTNPSVGCVAAKG